jgi:alpha-L-fucosidase
LQSANAQSPEGFADYQRRKVIPQVKELLTEYGPIDLVWFDNPINTTPQAAKGLKKLVRKLQPKAIVNGRIGFELGDYRCLGDNQVSAGGVAGDWETIATMNKTWGYKKTDHDWKSAAEMIRTLVDITSKGGTYLLNVGPTGLGVIPRPSVDRLRAIGRWLRVNGDAVYGTKPSPFPYDFEWGRVTSKGKVLYLLFFDWPDGKFRINGIKSKVRRARLLAHPSQSIGFSQQHDARAGRHVLELDLPSRAPDGIASVVAVETKGAIDVDVSLQQQAAGVIMLPAHAADMHCADYWGRMRIGQGGCITDWYSPDNWLGWKFKVFEPGGFDVYLDTRAVSLYGWKGGHKVEVTVAGQTVRATLKAEVPPEQAGAHYPVFTNHIGNVRIDDTGEHSLSLRTTKINAQARGGLTASYVRLMPTSE